MKNLNQEKDEKIIERLNEVVEEISDFIVKKHNIYFATATTTKLLPNIYKDCIDAIRSKIIYYFHKKKASDSAMDSFFQSYKITKEIKEVELHQALRELEKMNIIEDKQADELMQLFYKFQEKTKFEQVKEQISNEVQNFEVPNKEIDEKELLQKAQQNIVEDL
jgi:predicted transcriptional regulator